MTVTALAAPKKQKIQNASALNSAIRLKIRNTADSAAACSTTPENKHSINNIKKYRQKKEIKHNEI